MTLFSQSFDVFCLDRRELSASIRNEARLVRGRRRSSSASEDEVDHVTEKDCGGGGDDVTRVVLMCGWVSRVVVKDQEEDYYDDHRSELERAMTAFCFGFDIPYLPRGGRDDKSRFRCDNTLYRQVAGNNAEVSKEGKEVVAGEMNHDNNRNRDGRASGNRGNYGFGGGGGGGRPPPGKKSVNKPLPADYMTSTSESEGSEVEHQRKSVSPAELKVNRILTEWKEDVGDYDEPRKTPDPAARHHRLRRRTEFNSKSGDNLFPWSKKDRRHTRVWVDWEHIRHSNPWSTGSSTIDDSAGSVALPHPPRKLEGAPVDDFDFPISHRPKFNQLYSESTHRFKDREKFEQAVDYLEDHPRQPSLDSIEQSYFDKLIREHEYLLDNILEEDKNHRQDRLLRRHAGVSKHRELQRRRHLDPQFQDWTFMYGQDSYSRNQKDNDWHSDSEIATHADPAVEDATSELVKEKDKRTSMYFGKLPVDPDIQAFLDSTRLLSRVSCLFGLHPYENVVKPNRCVDVEWQPKSGKLVALCGNTFFFFITMISILRTLIWISSLKEPLPVTEKIIKVEFANHVPSCLTLAFMNLFLSIWGLSCALELGPHYADFMSRFHLSLFLTGYNVTEGISRMLSLNFRFLALFLSFLLLLFYVSPEQTATVQEAAGFIGFTILRPFNYELRQSDAYPMVQFFGFCVFAYSFTCFNVVLLRFLVYGKALENMARWFNLRLCFTLGKCSEEGATSDSQSTKVIPFQKLYAEHLIVSSVVKNFSHANRIVFYALLLIVAQETMLLIYLTFEIFDGRTVELRGDEDDEMDLRSEKFHSKVGLLQLAVPVRRIEKKSELLTKAFILFDISILGFLGFGVIMHNAGEMFHVGIEYIRRHGFVLCRSAKERRFVLSMINSVTPKTPLWIGHHFHFNKPFMLGFISFLTAMSMVMASFHPDRSGVVHINTCDTGGDCKLFQIRWGQISLLWASLPPITPEPFIPPDLRTTPEPPRDFSWVFAKHITLHPVCASEGQYPLNFQLRAKRCGADWPSQSLPTDIHIPYLYKPLEMSRRTQLDSNFSENQSHHNSYFAIVVKPFVIDSDQCPSAPASEPDEVSRWPCVTPKFSCNAFPFRDFFNDPPAPSAILTPSDSVVDCFGNEVMAQERDDCRNFKVTTMSMTSGRKVEPTIRLIFTRHVPDADREALLCCYHYDFDDEANGEVAARSCNMPNARVFNKVCQFDRPRLKGQVLQLYNTILAKLRRNEIRLGKQEDEDLARCLCRFDGSEPPPETMVTCSFPQKLPCKSDSTLEYTLECALSPSPGKMLIPRLFLTSGNETALIHVEHFRYASYCRGPLFEDNFTHAEFLSYPSPWGGPRLQVVDCAGTPIKVREPGDRDDCKNWKILTPTTNKTMVPPHVVLKVFNYSASTFRFEEEGKERLHLCCFHYAGDAFQKNEKNQLKYCNAPSFDAMNDVNWCKGPAEGRFSRLPSRFPGPGRRLQEQLIGKVGGVVAHYARKYEGKDLLSIPEERDAWTKCSCGNMIHGLNQEEFDKAVAKCKAAITTENLTPCDLYANHDPHRVFRMCDHSWPKLSPSVKIMTPIVFGYENGLWEAKPRFSKIGDPSKTSFCLEDETWEDRWSPNGMEEMLDCDLQKSASGDVDDCGNLPIRGPNYALPELKLVPVIRFAEHDPSYDWEIGVHCCFHFDGYLEQYRVCDMPNVAAARARCDRGMAKRSGQRLRHEFQYSKRHLIDNLTFKGDRVKLEGHVIWWTQEESIWLRCICWGDRLNQRGMHEDCFKQYLPPCLQPKTKISMVTFTDTYVTCATSWTGPPANLRVPIVMQSRDNDVLPANIPRFLKNGVTPVDCPSLHTIDILTTPHPEGGAWTDCYGQTIDKVELDDCGNAKISTTSEKDPWGRHSPKFQLIPADSIPDLLGGTRFFCCYQYAISLEEEVGVCNMPSLEVFNKQCSDTASERKEVMEFAHKLRRRRREAKEEQDVLKKPFSDEERQKWTSCICDMDLSKCLTLS